MNDTLPINPNSSIPSSKRFPLKIIVLLIALIILGTLGTVFYPVIKHNIPLSLVNTNDNKFDINKPEIVTQDLNKLTTLTPEGRQAVQSGFERDWNQASTDLKKYDAYAGVYSSLYAGWNVTKDPSIKQVMKKVQEFMGSRPEWKQRYDLHVKAGAFLK